MTPMNLPTQRLHRQIVCALIVSVFATFSAARSGESGQEGDAATTAVGASTPGRIPTGPDGLPPYKHIYSDGLYSTVTAMNTFYVPELKTIKKTKLKVPGFKKDVQVYSLMQPRPAPLVVILIGMDGKVDGPWGDLFPYWYSEAGFSVLTFDGPFAPDYPRISGKGVTGNFDAEAEQSAQIIDAFLKNSADRQNISHVGVVGISFGGNLALNMACMAKEGKLPFELSGCLALSPAIKLRTAARVVDKFFSEDRWTTTMVELAKKFGSHVPVTEGVPVPFTATDMRAAIGYVFRSGLKDLADFNDTTYRLNLLPDSNSVEENRMMTAESYGLERFMNEFTFPYWQKKGAVASVDELWAKGELKNILPKLPDYAQAIIAENDPFVTMEELVEARVSDQEGKHLIVLPNGGHLGYIASEWALIKSLRIFGSKVDLKPRDASDKK